MNCSLIHLAKPGILLGILALMSVPATAQQWNDDFEGYVAGSQVVGQGGWEEWGPGAGALVSATQARGGANSIDISGPSDLVHQYKGCATGKWKYTAWQYVPTGVTAKSYFILLNTYDGTTATYSWSVQMGANPATGMMEADAGGGNVISLPIVYDQWVPIEVIIHLDADWCQLYYNGTLIDDPALADHPILGGGYSWTGTVFGGGGGILNIGAVDLYANSATSVFYDDMSLEPYWQDGFDAYAAGSQAVGQGFWTEWGPGAGALVSNAQARTGANSIDINGPTDLVHTYSGFTRGKWMYTAWQYVPTGLTAESYFLLLNTYDAATATYDWSVQMGANPSTNTMDVDAGGGAVSLPLIYDQWVAIQVVIDLDLDWCQIYYDGTLVDSATVPDHPILGGGYKWTGGVFGAGGGLLNIGCVDLYANNATSVYYDDLSLVNMSWSDHFDSYDAGSQVVGMGGWTEWGPGAGALVSNAQARSGANSIDINGGSDLVHTYSDITTGKWKYTAWQYVPTGLTALSYFIMLNTYDASTATYDWSVQMGANPTTGTMDIDAGDPVSLPLVYDQWVPIEVVIHLDQDWCQIFYNGTLADAATVADHPTLGGGYAWTGGVFGGGSGALNIGAVDLYANNASPVYYDDISLEPMNALSGDAAFIEMSTGGSVNFDLAATTQFAGRLYVLIGNFTGTDPGLPLPTGIVLPLNYDPIFDLTLALSGTPGLFDGFFGLLDSAGNGSATLTLPGDTTLVGLNLNFAYTLLDPPGFDMASNPVPVLVTP